MVVKYNPYAPWIVGMEWAGIQKSSYQMDADVERGYTFALETSTTVVSGGFYIDEPTPGNSYKVGMISLYQAGNEALTGPVQRVVIPVVSTTQTVVTGAGGGNINTGTGFTTTQAVQNPSDSTVVTILGNATLNFLFDVSLYSSYLDNKRILDVNVLYSMSGDPGDNNTSYTRVLVKHVPTGGGTHYQEPVVSYGWSSVPQLERHELGSVNLYTDGSHPIVNVMRYPWRYEDLLRFDTGGELVWTVQTTATGVSGITNPTPPEVYIAYVALEVLYCEETRLMVGGKGYTGSAGTMLSATEMNASLYRGLNTVLMRPIDTLGSTGKLLTPGNYTLTVNVPALGSVFDGYGGYPSTYALRQQRAISSPSGVEIVRSLRLNRQFTRQDTDILTPIALYTASGIVTGTHVYCDVPTISVYDGNDAKAEIIQAADGASVSYPQVRFYARRFGDTNVALTVFRTVTPTQTASISVADFDALPEIVDGWREVTLRFSNVPTFSNSLGNAQWTFQATGLAAGSQWQILAMYVEYVSGRYNPVNATYGRDVADVMTGSTLYDGGDAYIIFSQDPPAVSGFALQTSSQSITGIGSDCDVTPACIPTGISYFNLTWLPTSSMPASAFGYYEIQRMDTLEDDWSTIAKITNISRSSMRDYEARVGVSTSYRIRTANVYEFFGAWSTAVTGSISTPGVSGVGDGNSTLIFTTNEQQDGLSNLAYVMTWDNDVVEDYSFPEAEGVEFKQLYGRDYVSMFKPTERGGERFTRTILVNNAAVATGRVRDGFRSLRDLAWSSISYVCVRNELGDRWFAAVQVPSGRIQRNRRLYLARIDVTEITDTPTQIDI